MPFNHELSVSLWTELPEGDVLRRLRKALEDEGLEIVTQIEVSELIESEVGLPLERCTIIGVWNSLAAYHALLSSPEVGLVLPFQIVVASYHGGTLVAAINPRRLEEFFDKLSFRLLAVEVYGKLKRVLGTIEQNGAAKRQSAPRLAVG